MAAMQIIAFIFLAVTLLGGGYGVTDEEFKVGFIGFGVVATKFKSYLVQIRLQMSPYVTLLHDLPPLVI